MVGGEEEERVDEMFDVAVKVLVICGALAGAGAVGHVCGRVLATIWSLALDGGRRVERWWRRAVSHDLPHSPPPRLLDVQEQPWRGRASLRDPETTQPGMPALPAPGAEPEAWFGCTCGGAPHVSTCPLSTDRTAVTRRCARGASPPMTVDVGEHELQARCTCAEWPFQCRTEDCACEACHARP